MSQDKDAEIAALKARIAELEKRLAVADNDRAAWELYDKEGLLPPRTCEFEAARSNGTTSESLIAEMQAVFAQARRREDAA
ncbi:MAG: hypothetical protein K2W96_02640 [Gemmataceae bacterium]|nr:hypothetical protein [Gemmataceae bacterium]